MSSNIFSDLFNPKKKITYGFGKGLVTTTKGNTAGNVGTNTSQTKVNTNIFNPAQKAVDQANAQRKAIQAYNASGVGKTNNTSQPSVKPSQPTQSTQSTYDTNYQNYLKNRTATASSLAENNAEEERKAAIEDYNLEKQSLEGQLAPLKASFDSYKGNRATDVDEYGKVIDRNKENAITGAGAKQRTLAQTRRDQLNQNQKTYASLGTIDSYGTGSFTQANANDESDFLRMTNENYSALEDKLFTLDQDKAKYKRESDEKVSLEESKYTEAVRQINQLLGKNENMKTQALRAAQRLLAQKKAEINDEYESLMLENEKSRVEASRLLATEAAKGEEIKQAFALTSPEFQSGGRATTMNDIFFVNKYKDAYEALMKNGGMGAGSGSTEKAKLTTLIDDIVGSGNLGRITGAQGMIPLFPGSKEATTKAQIDQLKALLSLENRQKLKGQGQISDKEMAILEKGSSILNQNLSEEQFRAALQQLKNELMNAQPESINAGALSLASQFGL